MVGCQRFVNSDRNMLGCFIFARVNCNLIAMYNNMSDCCLVSCVFALANCINN